MTMRGSGRTSKTDLRRFLKSTGGKSVTPMNY
jgi:hypothetical protein